MTESENVEETDFSYTLKSFDKDFPPFTEQFRVSVKIGMWISQKHLTWKYPLKNSL